VQRAYRSGKRSFLRAGYPPGLGETVERKRQQTMSPGKKPSELFVPCDNQTAEQKRSLGWTGERTITDRGHTEQWDASGMVHSNCRVQGQ